MNLHKCIVHPGIRTSEKFSRLNFFQRDLFYGLLSAAHKGGWFENNAGALRAALFAPCLGKVSERDLKDGLLKLREVELIKLWTGRNGRAYGAIINYRQKFDYGEELPDQGKPPDDELFQQDGPEPPPAPPPNRIEVSVKAPAAPPPHPPQDDAEWLRTLAAEHPEINLRAELAACLSKYPLSGRKFFEDQWLPNAEPPMRKGHHDQQAIEEPEGFVKWSTERYGQAPKPWASFTRSEKEYLVRLMRESGVLV